MSGGAVRIDIDRLVSRIEAAGRDRRRVGTGRRAWLRSPGVDRRRPRRDATWWSPGCTTSGSTSPSTRSGTWWRRCPGSNPTLAPVMTGSHIDTVRTGGRFDGNLGVLAGLEVLETLITLDITTERAVSVAFFTDEEGARIRPRHAGQPGVRGRDGAGGGARRHGRRRRSETRRRAVADRLRRADAVPGGGVPALLRRAAHRAGTDPGGGRNRDRRRRRRAGDLVDRAHDHRSVGACRHDTDAHAPRSWARRRTCDRVRARPHHRARGRSGGDGGQDRVPAEPGQRRSGVGDDDRRSAQYRRNDAAGRRAAPGTRARTRGRDRARGGRRLVRSRDSSR